MYYVVTYTTPFGDTIITTLEEEEFGLLLVPYKVLFKSKSFTEAIEYLHKIIN